MKKNECKLCGYEYTEEDKKKPILDGCPGCGGPHTQSTFWDEDSQEHASDFDPELLDENYDCNEGV